MLLSTARRYGSVAQTFHWVVAGWVVVMYALGLYMTGLDYHHPWYQGAPALHVSLGVLLFVVIMLRLAWAVYDSRPLPLDTHSALERTLARVVRFGLYALLVTIPLSGYLISTADGRSIDVFGWFQIPALLSGLPNQEDVAGEVHEVLAHALIILAGLHALAALKHHVFDHDDTLRRMTFMPLRSASPAEGDPR